jgi:hypothetical protein
MVRCRQNIEPEARARKAKRMTVFMDDFYRSSNGDRWQLVRDTASGRRVVRHEPNLASGGQAGGGPSRIGIMKSVIIGAGRGTSARRSIPWRPFAALTMR